MARFDRQRDLIKCDMHTPIMIVGAGGIGSFVTLTLAKMGFDRLMVYDFDTVEEHNLPNQFYRIEDIGKPKVEALGDIVMAFTGTIITTNDMKFEKEDIKRYMPKVVVSAVDNMETRKLIFDNTDEDTLFLDGRMGADQIEVYTINNKEASVMYQAHLWTDAETAPLPCTSKATMYNVLMIASLMANNIRLALMKQPVRPAIIVDNKNVTMHYIE
jgi:molybdopterin/thiamine biosynthesis adenylyltransferase